MASKQIKEDCLGVMASLCGQWRQLTATHTPYRTPRTIWQFNRPFCKAEPDQGWKIHISATLLHAAEVFTKVAPILARTGTAYKVPRSLEELARINSGIFYGYSQVGKVITVYPKTAREFDTLAVALHYATRSFPAPVVPFDFRLTTGSCIYYRYGVFRVKDLVSYKKTKVAALRGPDGVLTPDDRYLPQAQRSWLGRPGPFHKDEVRSPVENSPLSAQYPVFRAIVQRGKGGIYTALDIQALKPRIVILKEGRMHGETCWDGTDGRQRVENEMTAISELRNRGVAPPEIYDTFYSGNNFYLVMEQMEGINFQAFLNKLPGRLSRKEIYFYGQQVCEILATIHAAGWVWRDCKPANFMLARSGELRPLDFEGASRKDQTEILPWASDNYAAPEAAKITVARRTNLPEDLYALGVILFLLIEGELPKMPSARQPRIRRSVPQCLKDAITALLNTDPNCRPSASVVASLIPKL